MNEVGFQPRTDSRAMVSKYYTSVNRKRKKKVSINLWLVCFHVFIGTNLLNYFLGNLEEEKDYLMKLANLKE